MFKTLLATGVIALGSTVFASGAAQAAYATTDLNIRSCGSTGCARLGVIPGGGYVEILGQRGSWARVNYRGIIGWSSLSYISDGQVRRRNYYTYARPRVTVPYFGFTYYDNDYRWRKNRYRNRWSRRGGWDGHYGHSHRGYRSGLGPWVTWR